MGSHPLSEQVQRLFDFCVFGAQEVFHTLLSDLIPSDFHFTSAPQCLLTDRTKNLRVSEEGDATSVSQKPPCLELLDMQFSYVPFDFLRFHLQKMLDGIFGEWLFFL